MYLIFKEEKRKKMSGSCGFTGEFCKIYKEEILLMLHKPSRN